MSEKKKKKEIDDEPVSSVSLQRGKDWTVIHRSRPLQMGSCFIPLFYDIFISGTKTQGYWGGELYPPHFFRLRFSEKYLIENVENTMSEPLDFKIF